MRARKLHLILYLPLLLALGGCGYVHVGKLPEPTTTVIGDDKLMKENSDLKLEKKMLQQELALSRAQGDALRMAIENRAADGDTSRRLAEKLTETTRELTQLREGYAKLQAERNAAVASASESNALQAKLGAAEEKLANSLRTYTQLQDEISRLRTEVDKTRTENIALTEQVKVVTAQNAQVQAALAQLNTELLAQKDARVRAEQDAETLRTLVKANPEASALAQQRTGAAAEARSLAAEQAAEIVNLRKELESFRAKVDSLDREREQLKQKLAAGSAPVDLANMEARINDTIRANNLLRDENEILRSAKSGLETQLARLKDGPIPDQASALRDQLRDAQSAANSLTDENARLKARLAAAERAALRRSTAEPVTRINLDAPEGTGAGTPPAPAPGDGGTSTGDRMTSQTSATMTPSGGMVTRATTSGVSATLVTSPPGAKSGGATANGRVHVVTSGDTLSKISAQYYGTPTRWMEILNANRDILGENNNLVIGRTLRIP